MNVIDERQRLFSDKKKELVKDITEMVMKITTTVNARGKQLVVRLNEVTDSKLKVLNEKKDALAQLSSQTDHCIEFVKSALDKGSDSAVLFSKKTLSRHLQKVKCQRADIPNPEIPVRIQVQLNQVLELQKVIAQLGTILVDGKIYPPVVSPGPSRQQPSPNLQPSLLTGATINPQQQTPPPPVAHAHQQPTHAPALPALRPGMQPCRSPQMNPNINLNFMNNMYTSTSPHQQAPPSSQLLPNQNQQSTQQFVQGISRSFSQDGPTGPSASGPSGSFGRFPNMGPRTHPFRGGAPHVSSSTHPQNIGKYFQ